jgi:TonB family protein
MRGLIGFAISASLFAQDAAPVRARDPGVTKPELLSKKEPNYSKEARLAHLSGTVRLECVVAVRGVAEDCKVKRTLGFGLDEEAEKAVLSWRFKPGEKDGKPVPEIAVFDVTFKIGGNGTHWALKTAAFDSPEGALRPVLTKCEYPQSTPRGSIEVQISFDVDERGEPANLSIDKSVDSEPEQQIIAAVQKWRFKPATKNGRAVTGHTTLVFRGGHFAKEP